jgi:uncharacterized secreted repeat protein (TIGR03808 family)
VKQRIGTSFDAYPSFDEIALMTMNRRRLFAALAVSAGAATPALAREPAETMPRAEIDAASLGLRPNSDADQTATFQRAIERAAAAGAVLRVPAGNYRVGMLQLPSYAALAGVAGTTRLVMTGGPSMLASSGSDTIGISGLVLDGAHIPLPGGRGLVHLTKSARVRIADCEIVGSGGNGITLEAIGGEVTGNTIGDSADIAIFSNDAGGLQITGNSINGAGNGGILVWRSTPGDDGTLVTDNRIENIAGKSGGSGQYGNAINIFRADNVIVRGNRIKNAAFSAVRGNTASNLQIAGNTCSGLGEVALFVEFGFEGAVIANNIVDGAAVGVGVANFKQGGRLAAVQGNLIRNLRRGRPPGDGPSDMAATGISIEADAVVTGNIIDNVEGCGIQAGWGEFLRDVAISANVVRTVDYGITVSVVDGAGTAVIADNLIADARLGAIVGMEWDKPVTGDLSKDGADRYAQLSIDGNRVR